MEEGLQIERSDLPSSKEDLKAAIMTFMNELPIDTFFLIDEVHMAAHFSIEQKLKLMYCKSLIDINSLQLTHAAIQKAFCTLKC